MSDEYEYQHQVQELTEQSATAARLFDVRRLIGGLFVVYGIIVTIAGITASDADLKKAQNININLWTGLSMLVVGLLFLLWMWLRPATAPEPAPEPPAGPARPEGDEAA
ncbi:hypothetical protein [Streptomyces sp. NPDC048636]|uniref:hypothetical protein n=1 Tax=Streptomyces sp. NPDC048636 TaxID=3155762 RepID=UPI0034263CBB